MLLALAACTYNFQGVLHIFQSGIFFFALHQYFRVKGNSCAGIFFYWSEGQLSVISAFTDTGFDDEWSYTVSEQKIKASNYLTELTINLLRDKPFSFQL